MATRSQEGRSIFPMELEIKLEGTNQHKSIKLILESSHTQNMDMEDDERERPKNPGNSYSIWNSI